MNAIKNSFIFILVIVLFVYTSSLFSGFVFDDGHMVVSNILVRSIKYIPYFFKGEVTSYLPQPKGMFRPLLMLTFMLNYFISRLSPWSYHLFNVLLHLANIYLLFVLFCLTFPKTDRRLLAAFAFLFGIHPVNTEAVAYVSSRSDLLVSFFLLFALIKYIQKKYRLSFLFFVLAFLSKETAVIFLPLIFVYDLCLKTKTPSKRRYKFYLIVFLGTLFFVILRKFLYGSVTAPSHLRSFLDNIATQSYVSWFYLKLFLFPFKLCADWPIYTIKFLSLKGLGSIALIIAALTLSFLGRKRYSYLALGVFFYFLSLSPKFIAILNFPACEHHLYFPSIGLYIILAYFLSKFPYRRTKYLFWFVIPTFALLTFFRGFDYKNNYTFWRSVLKVNPHSGSALSNLASQAANEGNYSKAEELWQKAWHNSRRLSSRNTAYLDLIRLYLKEGKADKAQEILNLAFAQEKENYSVRLWNFKAMIYAYKKEYKKAEKIWLDLIRDYPDYPEFKADLGVLYLRGKKFDKARQFFEQALSEDPQEASWHWRLGLIYEREGEENKAWEEYKKAAVLGYKDWNLYFKLATILARHRDKKAEGFFYKASLLAPWEAKIWFNWGLFYLDTGISPSKGVLYLRKAEGLGYRIPEELWHKIRTLPEKR